MGLLDATLHTIDYVYSASFTLFSVICALGCAVSIRPRDRALYPLLVLLASGNIKWSIATSVKSLEIVQAIISMQYWAPICPTLADDPYWLNLSHVRGRASFPGSLMLTYDRLSSWQGRWELIGSQMSRSMSKQRPHMHPKTSESD